MSAVGRRKHFLAKKTRRITREEIKVTFSQSVQINTRRPTTWVLREYLAVRYARSPHSRSARHSKRGSVISCDLIQLIFSSRPNVFSRFLCSSLLHLGILLLSSFVPSFLPNCTLQCSPSVASFLVCGIAVLAIEISSSCETHR